MSIMTDEGQIPLNQLVANAGRRAAVARGSRGKLCRNAQSCADVALCSFLHKVGASAIRNNNRPVAIVVDDERVPVTEIRNDRGLQYAMSNGERGRWCKYPRCHIATCTFLHPRDPERREQNRPIAAATPSPAAAAHSRREELLTNLNELFQVDKDEFVVYVSSAETNPLTLDALLVAGQQQLVLAEYLSRLIDDDNSLLARSPHLVQTISALLQYVNRLPDTYVPTFPKIFVDLLYRLMKRVPDGERRHIARCSERILELPRAADSANFAHLKLLVVA